LRALHPNPLHDGGFGSGIARAQFDGHHVTVRFLADEPLRVDDINRSRVELSDL
jgi:hypothetical protein